MAPPEFAARRAPIAVGIELIQDISAISNAVEGFLRRFRHRIKTRLSDGTRTDVFVVDFIDREGSTRDAVGILAFARPQPGSGARDALVLLRRQVRYAAFLAIGAPLTTEILAGVIERPERAEDAALRELWEEGGIRGELSRIRTLGRPFFVNPGAVTERLYLVSIEIAREEIEAAAASSPPGDGSPFEEGSELFAITAGEALDAIAHRKTPADSGLPEIEDAKTEIALRRLVEAIEDGSL